MRTFPWNGNNKINSRQLEEVALFYPSQALPLTPRVMIPQGVAQPRLCRQAHRAEGVFKPQGLLSPSESPSPRSPDLNAKLSLWLPFPVPRGALRKTLTSPTNLCCPTLGTKLLHSFFGIKRKKILSTVQKKNGDRRINREACFVF